MKQTKCRKLIHLHSSFWLYQHRCNFHWCQTAWGSTTNQNYIWVQWKECVQSISVLLARCRTV